MQMKQMLLAGAAALVLYSTPSLAQDAVVDETTTAAIAPELGPGIGELRLVDLEERDIYNAEGDQIGEVEDVYRRGSDLFVRMQVDDGWFDIGENVMVPLSDFALEGDNLVLPINEDQAEALEEWTEGDYEEMAEALDNEPLADVYDDLD